MLFITLIIQPVISVRSGFSEFVDVEMSETVVSSCKLQKQTTKPGGRMMREHAAVGMPVLQTHIRNSGSDWVKLVLRGQSRFRFLYETILPATMGRIV